MVPAKRHLSILALFLGFLGVAVCVVVLVAVWSMSVRLSRVNEEVFARIDEGLAVVRDRVADAQRRVEQSKMTTQDLADSLKSWTQQQARARLVSRLEVEEKAAQLALGLRQSDQWLEISGVSMAAVQQALALANSLGAPVDAALVDPLLERLASLRNRLNQAAATIDGIHERAAATAAGEGRMDRAVELAVRVVATLSEVDSLLGGLADRLSEIQTEARRLKAKAHRWIVTATIGVALLIGWMGVGQASLCLQGWKGCRRARSSG